MPYKDPHKQKVAQHESYLRHKDMVHKRDRERKTRIIAWFAKLKLKYFCSECGENHPACLDFHHRDPLAKTQNISEMVWHGFGEKKILAEMNKCDVLCANCHRKKHFQGKGIIRRTK